MYGYVFVMEEVRKLYECIWAAMTGIPLQTVTAQRRAKRTGPKSLCCEHAVSWVLRVLGDNASESKTRNVPEWLHML